MIEAGVKDVSITIDSEDFSIESILSNIIPIIDFFYSAYIYNNPDSEQQFHCNIYQKGFLFIL